MQGHESAVASAAAWRRWGVPALFHVWLVITEDPYLHHARGQQLARGHAILGPKYRVLTHLPVAAEEEDCLGRVRKGCSRLLRMCAALSTLRQSQDCSAALLKRSSSPVLCLAWIF